MPRKTKRMKAVFATCIVMLMISQGESVACSDYTKVDHGKTCSANWILTNQRLANGYGFIRGEWVGWTAWCMEPDSWFELVCNSGGFWRTSMNRRLCGEANCVMLGKGQDVYTAICK